MTFNNASYYTFTTYFPSADYFASGPVKHLNQHQNSVLNYLYLIKPYMTRSETEKIANMLGAEYHSVAVWFERKRFKTKRSKSQSHRILLRKMLQIKCVHNEELVH